MLCSNWSDHDRSGRYITRDMAFGRARLSRAGRHHIRQRRQLHVPLWYAREVERIRPDVRIINLAYLGTPWYARQMTTADRESRPVEMTAKASDLAYDNFAISLYGAKPGEARTRDAIEALADLIPRPAATRPG